MKVKKTLKRGTQWGYEAVLVVSPGCGHRIAIPEHWVEPDGRVRDRVGCTECRATYDFVLEDWAPEDTEAT